MNITIEYLVGKHETAFIEAVQCSQSVHDNWVDPPRQLTHVRRIFENTLLVSDDFVTEQSSLADRHGEQSEGD